LTSSLDNQPDRWAFHLASINGSITQHRACSRLTAALKFRIFSFMDDGWWMTDDGWWMMEILDICGSCQLCIGCIGCIESVRLSPSMK
jgi:hypothetical protein